MRLCSLCVSVSPLRSGGWVQTQMQSRWGKSKRTEMGFFPSLFFSSLSIYSSRAAECHLLSHNWSRNERCLFVAASVCVCVCQSTLHLHLDTLWHFSYLLVCELGINYYCIAINILEVLFYRSSRSTFVECWIFQVGKGCVGPAVCCPNNHWAEHTLDRPLIS